MKFYIKSFYLVFFLVLFSCNSKNDDINEGILTYEIDYPEIKDNFFLYHVLPKELKTSFKNEFMELKIKKANMENTLIINSKDKKMSAYYNYGDVFTSQLNEEDIQGVLSKFPDYKIKITEEKDTLLGFDIQKAIAIDPKFPEKEIELWFTNDIKIENSNWFNGFKDIPGVLLKYSIVQYGIKMEFKANKFENVTISDSIVNLKRPGKVISHKEYDKRINDLFESFK
jgi:GLPGLI family protein